MKINIVLLIAIIIYPILTFSQTYLPKLDWYNIYDGTGNSVDLTNDVKMDILNNIYLCGRSVGLDGTDLLILKYSESGDSLLEIKFNSAPQSWDEGFSLAIDAAFNIYVIGRSTFEQNTFYAIFQKYSSNGTLLWSKDFNQDLSINSEGRKVVLNSKEEAIIGYNRISANIGKYTSTGDSIWTISFEDDTSWYEVNYIITDRDDNIYASVLQYYDGGGELPTTRVLILKISDAGEILWIKNTEGDGGRKITLDKDDNPIFLISTAKIIKCNTVGDTLWTKEYRYTSDIIIATDIIVDTENNILFTGYGLGNDSWDYYTYKFSSNGDQLWRKIFNSDEQLNDFAAGLNLDNKNNVYVTGGTHNSISEGYCYTIKYSSAGELEWKYKFDAPRSIFETGNKIFVDDSNKVYVGGDVADTLNGYNFLAFKIKQDLSTGLKGVDIEIPSELLLSQNYPNPFNPLTIIEFSLPESDNVKIEIFDNLGRFISELFQGYLAVGHHKIDFNASNLASGIYYYRLKTSKNSLMKKAVLIK